MSRRPFHSGVVHVMADKCATCVFRPGNLMSLAPGRLAGMVAESTANESAITCHSTLYGQADQEAVCRGFYDRHPTLPLRLAQSLGVVVEVDPS